jgi:RNA polymerase sigma-54 factor
MQLALRQRQNLILSAALQQAFLVLQMPHLELAEWLKTQIEQNPLLEYDESKGIPLPLDEECEIDFEKESFNVLDSLDEAFQLAVFPEYAEEKKEDAREGTPSLYEHLMNQAQLAFDTKEELAKAEEIIGNLDDRGFLTDFSADPVILAKIQTFDPPGIAARTRQESFLIQLKLKERNLAYCLVRDHFEELLQRKFPIVAKKFGCSFAELRNLLQKDIGTLDFCPGSRFRKALLPPLIPDVILKKEGGKWVIEICDSHLPRFHLLASPKGAEKGDQSYIRRHIAEGKWLLRTIRRRHETLRSIIVFLIEKQTEFFNGNIKKFAPLTMQEAATSLNLHESTIARAVSHKYLSCSLGIFALRTFFSHAITTFSGKKISNRTVRQLVYEMVEKEDKTSPLSDQEIAQEIQKLGIPCARRTVTKHRQALKLAAASLRRKF